MNAVILAILLDTLPIFVCWLALLACVIFGIDAVLRRFDVMLAGLQGFVATIFHQTRHHAPEKLSLYRIFKIQDILPSKADETRYLEDVNAHTLMLETMTTEASPSVTVDEINSKSEGSDEATQNVPVTFDVKISAPKSTEVTTAKSDRASERRKKLRAAKRVANADQNNSRAESQKESPINSQVPVTLFKPRSNARISGVNVVHDKKPRIISLKPANVTDIKKVVAYPPGLTPMIVDSALKPRSQSTVSTVSSASDSSLDTGRNHPHYYSPFHSGLHLHLDGNHSQCQHDVQITSRIAKFTSPPRQMSPDFVPVDRMLRPHPSNLRVSTDNSFSGRSHFESQITPPPSPPLPIQSGNTNNTNSHGRNNGQRLSEDFSLFDRRFTYMFGRSPGAH